MATIKKGKESPSCSVVIRCYNEEKHIGRLLHGVSQQTIKDIEIIVVDSGSTDGTLSIASRYPSKILKIGPEKFSFGRSLNLGCRAAESDIIVIASAHVYPVYRDWIEQLLAPFQNSKVGMVYGKQQGGETTKFAEHQIFERWFPDKSTPAQNHPFCNNANAAIRRVLWNQFLYNEEITGLEDVELANRILKAGYRLSYQAGAAVVHLHDEIHAQICNRYRREAMAFKRIFPNETFSIKDFLRLFVSNTVSDYKHALRNGARYRDFYEIPLFRLMQFCGTYQGFKDSGSITSRLKQTFYYPNGTKAPPAVIRPEDPMLINYQSRRRSYRENR
jgi:glycosyltransferase involved in cell wall biosynthesis